MKQVLRYLPYVLAVGLFFAGKMTSPRPDKELLRKYEVERKTHLNQIVGLEGLLADRDKAALTIRNKMYVDSLKNIGDLRAKDRVILKQQKENEKINLSRASALELDSIRAAIITLHTLRGK